MSYIAGVASVSAIAGATAQSPDRGERGGATSVSMALIWTAMIAFVLATVQAALFYLTGQLALTAAQDGLRAGRTYPAVSTARAQTAAEDFLARAAGTTLGSPTVTATLSPDGAVLQVDVTGTVPAVIPGVELRVAKRAAGAVERPAP